MQRLMGSLLVLALSALSAPLSGCDDDLPKATLIERLRVLGARIEVVGDEQRATPRPGERVSLFLPTVFPAPPEGGASVHTMLIRCTTPSQFTGSLPICQEFLDAALGDQAADVAAAIDMNTRLSCDEPVLRGTTRELMGVSLSCIEGAPSVELGIPDGFTARSALYLGIVCEDGAPYLDPTEPAFFGCDGDPEAESILINGQIEVLHDDDAPNLNPSLAASEFLMDLGPWPPWDPTQELPPADNCLGVARREDDDALRVADIGDHEITIRYLAGARELDENGEPERLELSVYATAGELERRFTIYDERDDAIAVDPDDDERKAFATFDVAEVEDGYFEDTLEWDPGDAEGVESGGGLVHFFITLRDDRGGFDIAHRVVCMKK